MTAPTAAQALRTWRLLLVDDHSLFREGLARLFAYEDDFLVVGEASSGEEALELAPTLHPDVILIDINMPGMGGLATIRALSSVAPSATLVALTVHEDDDTLFAAVRSGAHGYLVKSVRAAEMLTLLRGLADGDAPLTRGIATRILAEFARGANAVANQPSLADASPTATHPDTILNEQRAVALATLSLREEEVLALVATRLTNKEIATRLTISEFTVKNHLRSILGKLHLTSRTQAARLVAPTAWPTSTGTAQR